VLTVLLDILLFAMSESLMADEQVTSFQSLANETHEFERGIPARE
jgi:hypothetical protein